MSADHLRSTFASRYPRLASIVGAVDASVQLALESWRCGGVLYACGNGGSAADAEHIAAELLKEFRMPRPLQPAHQHALMAVEPTVGGVLASRLQQGLRAIALPGSHAFATAFSNDVEPVFLFAQLLTVLGRPGDVAFAISTSGTSKNVIAALVAARAAGMRTIGLTGRSGGSMQDLCDVSLCVPSMDTAEIQEMHRPIYHLFCALAEEATFGTSADAHA